MAITLCTADQVCGTQRCNLSRQPLLPFFITLKPLILTTFQTGILLVTPGTITVTVLSYILVHQKIVSTFEESRVPYHHILAFAIRALPNRPPFSHSLINPSLVSFRAYSFGHLKSAKSSENGRLRREKFLLTKEWEFIFYQVYRLQKMPKRIRPKFDETPSNQSFCVLA